MNEQGWQPIETAPKERYVLVYGPDGTDLASWEPWADAWMRFRTAEYDNDFAHVSSPTHFMPLPSPPEPGK